MRRILLTDVCVHWNTVSCLNEIPEFDLYYVAYLKSDPAQEPIAVGESPPEVLAEAAHKTGRAKADFELREISAAEYDRLKALLQLQSVGQPAVFLSLAASKMREMRREHLKASTMRQGGITKSASSQQFVGSGSPPSPSFSFLFTSGLASPQGMHTRKRWETPKACLSRRISSNKTVLFLRTD
jgi:hypothetical protein